MMASAHITCILFNIILLLLLLLLLLSLLLSPLNLFTAVNMFD